MRAISTAKILALIALLCVGFATAVPSSATWLGSVVLGKKNAPPKVVGVLSGSSGVTVRFTEKVLVGRKAFSLSCPAGKPHAFTQSASPAQSITLSTAKQPLKVGSSCALFIRGAL